MSGESPRRCRLELNTPIELQIRAVMEDVESLEADPLLSEVVTLLDEARNRFADWVDRQD